MSTPKVSVIIPVYQVENYIEKCARSLFAQTLDDIEYIFIDDCGGDSSINILSSILDEYPNRKNQVKLIRYTENKGVSQSRQDGLDAATGEYIIHCDPDDWTELNMYEALYNEATETNADIVFCDFYCYSNGKASTYTQTAISLTGISIIESVCGANNRTLHGSLWNKLIRASLYRNVKFPPNINYCEDVFVLLQILQTQGLKIRYLNATLYYYRINIAGSLVNRTDSKMIAETQNLISILNNSIPTNTDLIKSKKSLITTLIYRLFIYGNFSNSNFKNLYKSYIPYMKENKRIRDIDRLLLRMAMSGMFNISKSIRNFLILIRKNFK